MDSDHTGCGVLSIPHKPAKKEALRMCRSGGASNMEGNSLLPHICKIPRSREWRQTVLGKIRIKKKKNKKQRNPVKKTSNT